MAKGEVGMASIDLKEPVLLLYQVRMCVSALTTSVASFRSVSLILQFPDTTLYMKATTKLLALRPVEVV